jgi:RHS repeat-associated protein
MKAKLILIAILSFCALTGSSQQPFAEYGYKVKVATLSKGKYVEFFDQDTLVQIGTVVMNRFTKQIVSFVTVDTAYSEATLQPELISRWISPDPLAEKYYSYSPYHFSGNNPIRYVDPTGMYFIDYYDQGGNKIGTDGNNDGRIVVVTNNKEAKSISATDKAGGTTSMDKVKSGVELPSASVRGEMGVAVMRTMTPNIYDTEGFQGNDPVGGFHEEGGIFGTANGVEKVIHAKSGLTANPDVDPYASVDVFSGETATNYLDNVSGTFHTHPGGVTSSGSSFQQQPSNFVDKKTGQRMGDVPNALANSNPDGARYVSGNHYVLATGSAANGGQKVYIYNSTGVVATFPLKQFTSIGVNKP